MRKKYLNIDVRREDIAGGKRYSRSACPIALSLRRRLKTEMVSVDFEGIVADREQFHCSHDIEAFMDAFDNGDVVNPSRFSLERA